MVAVSPDGQYVYVVGTHTRGIAVVNVRIPNDPTVVAGIHADSFHFDYSTAVAVSPDGNYVYVIGSNSDSLAVVQWQNCTAKPITRKTSAASRWR